MYYYFRGVYENGESFEIRFWNRGEFQCAAFGLLEKDVVKKEIYKGKQKLTSETCPKYMRDYIKNFRKILQVSNPA